mmetsp:Transcript_24196/g.81555  ORF Transcript_24196/g.81555 Transcript_24196/m.81555 type:complete len:153 (+) Transcript_24196:55-513(+)
MFARVLLVALAATAMRLEPVEPFEEAQEMTCDDALEKLQTLAKVEEKSATEDAQFEAAYVKFSSCEKERQAVQEAMQRAQPRAKRFTRPKPTFVERQIRELKKMAPKIVSTLGVFAAGVVCWVLYKRNKAQGAVAARKKGAVSRAKAAKKGQ